MSEIKFDAAEHRYTVNGRELPSVTQILNGVGLIDSTWFTPESAMLGQYVHEATRLHDLDALDESTVDERIRPYLAAWRAFRQTTEFVPCPDWIERPVATATYAGTLDRLGRMRGTPWLLIDIKTGTPDRWHALQTAAYMHAAYIEVRLRISRACVYLRDDGNFKMVPHTDSRDFAVFDACALIYNWRKAT